MSVDVSRRESHIQQKHMSKNMAEYLSYRSTSALRRRGALLKDFDSFDEGPLTGRL